MRCLAIADAWLERGGEVDWFTAQMPEMLRDAVRARDVRLHDLDTPADWKTTAEYGRRSGAQCVVVDGYGFESGPSCLRRAGLRVAVIDDDGRWPLYDCDVLINHNVLAEEMTYRALPETQLLLGPSYALLRREFRLRPRPERTTKPVTRVLASFGGDDAARLGERVAKLVPAALPGCEVTVSRGFTSRGEQRADSSVRHHVGANLVEVMAAVDLAIVTASSICWELAYMGVPAITVTVASNQERVARSLHARGLTESLGWHHQVSDEAIVSAVSRLAADTSRRAAMIERGRALVDGQGAARVCAVLSQGNV
jgi:spore coat polysaccharide biosynthesis predicted glycosyltransferase SpsG